MNYILAIESAIGGGSISLFQNEEMVAEHFGTNNVSRSEDLLPNITNLLQKANISINEVDQLAISLGPGSYTGIRIGISTVLGLAKSLDIPCFGISAFEALKHHLAMNNRFVIALQAGRTEIAWQMFNSGSQISEPTQGNIDNFLDMLDIEASVTLASTENIIDNLYSLKIDKSVFEPYIINPNLSYYIGLSAVNNHATKKLEPLYLFNRSRGQSLF